jgi:hypothetical protein
MRGPVALVAGALLMGACSNGGSGADLKPHPLPGAVTSVVDYSAVALPRVAGTTTTTTAREQGTATIDGSVSGPSGPLPGATVTVEHLVGGKATRTDAVTGADGRFALPNLPGGRYRVRAYLAPALALVTPEVRFIPDGKPATFDLKVEDQRRVVARAAVAPTAPFLGDDVNLAVLVANRTVDADGVVRSTPIPGLRVELSGLGAYTLREAGQPDNPFAPRTTTTFSFQPSTVAFTDGLGQVQFGLHCSQAGAPGLELLVSVNVTPTEVPGQPPGLPTTQVEHLALAVPPCIDPASTTTTAAPDVTGDGTGRTTTTGNG